MTYLDLLPRILIVWSLSSAFFMWLVSLRLNNTTIALVFWPMTKVILVLNLLIIPYVLATSSLQLALVCVVTSWIMVHLDSLRTMFKWDGKLRSFARLLDTFEFGVIALSAGVVFLFQANSESMFMWAMLLMLSRGLFTGMRMVPDWARRTLDPADKTDFMRTENLIWVIHVIADYAFRLVLLLVLPYLTMQSFEDWSFFNSPQFWIFTLVYFWANRVSVINFTRSYENKFEEDYRHRSARRRGGKYWSFRCLLDVFLLYSLLSLIIGSSSYAVVASPVSWQSSLQGIGVVIAILGFIIQGVADFQLTAFKRGSYDKEVGPPMLPTLKSGLWRFSRHPNYLGEVIFWVGIAMTSSFTAFGAAAFVSPLIIFLWLRFESATAQDISLQKRHSDYPEYAGRINIIVPSIRFTKKSRNEDRHELDDED